MEQEPARLQEGIASIQDTYGQDHLHLTVIKGYVGKLLGNARILRYLAQKHPEFLAEFQTITGITPAEIAEADERDADGALRSGPNSSAATAGDAGAGPSRTPICFGTTVRSHAAGSSEACLPEITFRDSGISAVPFIESCPLIHTDVVVLTFRAAARRR